METNYSPISIKIGEIFQQGWELTKKHCPIFLLMIFLIQLTSQLPSYAYYGPHLDYIKIHGTPPSNEEFIKMLIQAGRLGSWIGQISLLGILTFFISCYLNATNYRMLYATVKEEKVDMSAELKKTFKGFWLYTGAHIVYTLIVGVGLIFFLLPGIYLGIRYLFVPIIAANHPELPFSEIFSRSWQMTKNHFGELLLLGTIVIGINIVGFLCCCVGVLFTTVFSNFMLISVYQLLAPPVPTPEETSAISEETAVIS